MKATEARLIANQNKQSRIDVQYKSIMERINECIHSKREISSITVLALYEENLHKLKLDGYEVTERNFGALKGNTVSFFIVKW